MCGHTFAVRLKQNWKIADLNEYEYPSNLMDIILQKVNIIFNLWYPTLHTGIQISPNTVYPID